MLIDTDIHEYMMSVRDLRPYLSGHWRTVIDTFAYDALPLDPGSSWQPFMPSLDSRPEWKLDVDGQQVSGTSLDALREHVFEQERVTHGILDGVFYPDAFPGHQEFATACAAAYNDWQVEHWLQREPRLFGSVHVSTDDVPAAVREIERMAEHPQIVQVVLPAIQWKQYGAPAFRPVFRAAARHGLPVTFHQSAAIGSWFGASRNTFEWNALGGPQVAQAQLMSLISGGVLDELPDLKVVILETGVAWLAWVMLRADQQFAHFGASVPWVKRRPSEQIRAQVRLSTQPLSDIDWRDLVRLVDLVASEDVFMFSTDYPHYDADSFDTSLPPGMPAGLRDKIAFGNALETYARLAHLKAPAR